MKIIIDERLISDMSEESIIETCPRNMRRKQTAGQAVLASLHLGDEAQVLDD